MSVLTDRDYLHTALSRAEANMWGHDMKRAWAALRALENAADRVPGLEERVAELESERAASLDAADDALGADHYGQMRKRAGELEAALRHIADRFVRHSTVYNDEWREAWNKAHPEDQKIPLDETSEGAIYARVARAALAATPDGGVAPAETRVGISSYG